MNISKNDYSILIKLNEDDRTTEMKSYTIIQLSEATGLSVNKVRGAIKSFKLLNFVEEGAVSHSAKTYYITTKGIDKLKQL